MSQSFTRSSSGTMTAARVRYVMLEVGADFYGLVIAGLITDGQYRKWSEELTFLLENDAVLGFQVQFRSPGRSCALDYRVKSDGTILESGKAGGVDYFGLPEGTTASLFVNLNFAAPNMAKVNQYLADHGWGRNGHAVAGTATRDRSYSKDGYGVERSMVGNWQ